jgi:hypothetical protein
VGAIADADVASVAALMGDRARAMLQALIDGSERPAGELAKAAGVSAATASDRRQRLVAGGLVTVRSSGRHRSPSSDRDACWPATASTGPSGNRIWPGACPLHHQRPVPSAAT